MSPGIVDFGCGSGPRLRIQGEGVRTAVVASPVLVHLGRPVDLRVCGSDTVTLAAGKNRLRLRASEAFSPRSMVLTRLDAEPAVPDDHRPAVRAEGGGVVVEGGSGLLALRQNVNPGWQAWVDGRAVAAVTVDGWQQGFALDGDEGTVRTRFAPTTLHQWGLGVGAATFAVCALLLLLLRRRPGAVAAPALGVSRVAPALAAAGWLAAGGLLAGWVGAAVLGGTAALLWLLRSRWEFASLLALAPLAVVGGWYAVRPWADPLGWAGSAALAQWLMLVPLAAVSVAATVDRPRLRNRDSGRSTSQ